MATNFPNSPSNGATHTFGGNTYTYNSTVGAWQGPAGSSGGGGASVTVSETAPTSPSAGDLWFDPSVLKTFLYYQDGSSNQWVQTNPSGSGSGGSSGASVTASDTAPSSPSAGDLWYKSDTNVLYVYYTDADSSQWVGVSGPAGATGATGAAGAAATGYGQVPIVYTEPPTTHTLNSDGSTSTVQMQAVDPEGTSITYAIAYANATNARPNQLAADTSINQTTGTFTFDPSTTTSHAGSFKARLSASDGITHATRFVDFTLSFYPIASSAILAQYHFYDTNSYNPSTSTTALNDISGNSNNQTITNPGTHTSDSNLTFNANTYINFTGLNATKAWFVLLYPTTGWDVTILWNEGTAGSVFYSTFHSGQTSSYYNAYSAHSGETIVDRVNGTNPTNRQTAYNAIDIGKMNSVINSGTNMTPGLQYANYPSWDDEHLVRAMVFFNRAITLTEMEALHNFYRTNWLAAGGTMPTWGN